MSSGLWMEILVSIDTDIDSFFQKKTGDSPFDAFTVGPGDHFEVTLLVPWTISNAITFDWM
jgi:hypothetical protein